ncbi:MAG: ABC transporter ATP-binding protein [Rhodocyclales bacterium]|jgi:phospholipid/cholesterol/gamma-HCH transport system ATP-binding protein|nr:ABC transporter ATP-binding protein [Rhodocyclales bacterium]
MADENIIEVEDIHFAYGDNQVLSGLSLRVPRGKVVAILGVSGSGKSTLLKLIGGQIRPQRGTVQVNGEIVNELDNEGIYALRREMGMMFQAGGLFSDLSVYENIAFPMRELTDLPDELIHRMVLMKLQAVGLRGASTLMPNELSGGMARRVALARAIALDPSLIMYDEPFAGLDPISLNVIAHLIRSLNDALDVTSIVVSYDVMESLMVADYAYFIHDGKLVAEGTSQEILASKDPFVHQFVNAKPDGPVAFHHPAEPLGKTLRLAA